MNEVSIANLAFGVFWIVVVLSIFIISRKNKKVQSFKENMMKMWKYSLAISLISYICPVIGNLNISYLSNFMSPIFLFCECLIGFTIAKSINGYEPLPVTKSFSEHKHPFKEIIKMILFGLLITVIAFVLSQLVPKFGETINSSSAVKSLPQNKWLMFFTLLFGAGIVEETVYRLIFLSLFWKITNNRWFSIILSALLFGLYHLSPLNSMYKIYWGYPIHQFVSATVAGIVFGYFYTKRGYETAVVGHTLSDWLPILIFMK